jgi:DNA-binding NarL/FixJ family response regulator
LSLRAGTVKVHVAAVLRSLGVPNRTAAASIAVQLLDER